MMGKLSVCLGVVVIAMYVYSVYDILLSWLLLWVREVTVEVLPKPKRSLWDDVLSYTEYYLVDAYSVLSIGFLSVVSVTISWLLLRRLARFSYWMILRMRGVRGIVYESMQPGSEFSPMKMPPYQVYVSQLGLFVDSFVGMAFRVGDFLVMPRHVYEEAGCDCVLSTLRAKYRLNIQPIPLTHPDTLAFPVPAHVWADLGISSATLMRDMVRPVDALCVGMRGASYGRVTKAAEQVGCVFYTGSTEHGMSGAPLVVNGQVVGMHIGSFAGRNLAVSSMLLAMDLDSLSMANEGKKRNAGYWTYNNLGQASWLSGGSGKEENDLRRTREEKEWGPEDVRRLMAMYKEGNYLADRLLEDKAFRAKVGFNSLEWESIRNVASTFSPAEKKALIAALKADEEVDNVSKPVVMEPHSGRVAPSLPQRVFVLENTVAGLCVKTEDLKVRLEKQQSPRESAPPKKVRAELEAAKVESSQPVPPPAQPGKKRKHRSAAQVAKRRAKWLAKLAARGVPVHSESAPRTSVAMDKKPAKN